MAAGLELFLADGAATMRLGEDIAMALKAGDVLALSGDLGAGKTTLARSLIRALAGDPRLEVPSPTFTLVQAYDTPVPVAHFDLYRLSTPDELEELGFDEARAAGIAILEWPEKAGDRLPDDRLVVELTHEGEGRRATLSGGEAALGRVERSLAMRDFLADADWGEATRTRFTGDASARAYETVRLQGNAERVLMNSPRLVLGPPVRDGKPYAEIAHSAQTVAAFVALDKALHGIGVTVPTIHAQDIDRGFLLLEHLGTGAFLDPDGKPIAERYAAAAELLAMIHRKPVERRIEVAPGVVHEIPPFDRGALIIEVDLLVDWYVPAITGAPPTDALRTAYHAAWTALFDRLDRAEQGLVLRDFHSPNIVWRPERMGHERMGILDFQDAMIGASAYDVASLAMDARVTVPAEIESSTVAAYVAAREAGGGFDAAGFTAAYAIMAAQRNSKILGIFVRLHRRDGKPQYLKHLPRIRDYLRRALAHPALAELHALYKTQGFLDEVAL